MHDASSDSHGEHSTDKDHVEYFQSLYRQPDLLIPWDIRGPQPDIKALHKTQPRLFASPVLDVGAGMGNTSIWLALTLGLDVVACDVSDEALAEGRTRFAAALSKQDGDNAVGSFRSVHCDICAPLPEALTEARTFATVLDSAAFHCIGGPKQQHQYAEAVKSLLRPAGHLIMLAHSDRNGKAGTSHSMRHVSEAELRGLFNEENGWTIKELHACRYCCMTPSLPGKPLIGAAFPAWLMVACRLGDSTSIVH